MCIRDSSNTHIAAVECEQTRIIENKREQTFIITDDNSNTIINTREECKIQSKHSYRVGVNIQSSSYTHKSKSHKVNTQLKQITRDKGTPVSYTHLDVYKRQPERRANCSGFFFVPLLRLSRGVKHILVCIDVFSKAVHLYPCLLYTSRCV